MSLLIGKHIKARLTDNEAVKRSIGARIYPIVSPTGVDKYPFIYYKTLKIESQDCNDGVVMDEAEVCVAVVAKSYAAVTSIAQQVRFALTVQNVEYEEFCVDDTRLIATEEDYIEELEAYVLKLFVRITTTNNF